VCFTCRCTNHLLALGLVLLALQDRDALPGGVELLLVGYERCL